jgi:hypothetical protein
MAIYRGPGGSGDATDDAANAAALIISKVADATAAADAANNSASDAASSATAAAASATASANSATNSASSAASIASLIPSQTGNSGKFLKTNGTATSWGTVDVLPTQTGNSGKYLTTDGSSTSWSSVSAAAATYDSRGSVFGRTDTGTYSPPSTITNGTNGYWFYNPDAYSIYSDLGGDYNGPGAPGDINTAVGNGTIQVGMNLILTCTRISTGLQEPVDMGTIASITTGGSGAVTITGSNSINWSLYATSGVWFGDKLIVYQLALGGLIAENVTFGHNAGQGITTGGENVLLGDSAGNNVGSGRNNVVIGNSATASAQNVSNEVTLGNSSHTKTRLFGALALGGSSVGTSGQVLTSNGSSSAPSWSTANSGTVTSVTLTVPTGLSVSGSPITTTGTLAVTFASGYSIPTDTKQTNWDTAYGWGNHASAGYLTSATAASTYAPLTGTGTSGTWGISVTGNAGTVTNGLYSTGSYSNPTWLTSVSGSIISGNISGNAANVTGTVAVLNGGTGATTASGARTNLGLVIGTDVPSPTGSGASGTWGISISGNAATVTNGLYSTGSYSDPSWLTTLASTKITGTINGGTY